MRKKNTVRDESGRQRFHGAFTGGFSAGYYNTVGSEEGFQPKTFVSSRKQRAEKNVQSIRDFMDEEDGLLGGSLTAKNEVDSFQPQNEQRQKSKSVLFEDEATSENSRAVQLLLANLVIEPTNTMGKRILGVLGWKPGMAIGPRVKKVEYSNLALSRNSLPQQSLEDGMITVAPREDKSAFEVYPTPKTNYQGIGYVPNEFDSARDEWEGRGENARYDEEENRYRVSDLFKKNDPSNKSVDESARRKPQKRKTAVYLDDDDDIAFHDDEEDRFHYSKTAIFEGDLDEDEDNNPKKLQKKEQEINQYIQSSADPAVPTIPKHLAQIRSPSDNKLPLPGFHAAQNAQMIPSFFPPPEIPKDLKPIHFFRVIEDTEVSQQKDKDSLLVNTLKIHRVNILENAEKRKNLLETVNQEITDNEEKAEAKKADGVTKPSKVPSVFDYLKPADRARILGLAQKINPTFNTTTSTDLQQTAPQPLLADLEIEKPAVVAPPVEEERRPLLVSSSLLTSAFAGLSESFKNRFTTSAATANTATPGDPVNPIGVVKEGLASLQEYTQLVQEKQKQFITSADSTKTTDSLKSGPPSQRIHRTTVLWTPNPLLCKRCHIKMPEIATISQSSSSTSTVAMSEKSSTADAMFQRLFNDVPSSSAPKKSKEEEEKERKEKEKREQQLQEEFNTFDVYQTSEPKPALSIFKSIFADSESEDESDAEEDEEESKVEKMEEKLNPKDNQNEVLNEISDTKPLEGQPVSVDKAEEVPSSKEELKMPKFIPRSRRSAPSNTESLISNIATIGKSNRAIVHASSSSRFKQQASLTAKDSENEEVEEEDDGLILLPPSQKVQRQTIRKPDASEVEENSAVINFTHLKRKTADSFPTSINTESTESTVSKNEADDDLLTSSIQFKKRRVATTSTLPLRKFETEKKNEKQTSVDMISTEQSDNLPLKKETASIIPSPVSLPQTRDVFPKTAVNEKKSESLIPESVVSKGIELLQQSLLKDLDPSQKEKEKEKEKKSKEKKRREKKEKKKKEKKSKKSSHKHHKKEKKSKKSKKSSSHEGGKLVEETKKEGDDSSDDSSDNENSSDESSDGGNL